MNHVVRIPFKVPYVLKLIAEHGADSFKSKIVNGRYFGPLVSPRKASAVRKRALADGGWDPAWDSPRKVYTIKPLKGHLRERNRPQRAEKITKALAGMNDRYEKYQKEIEDRKPKKDLYYRFKRISSILSKKNKDASHYKSNKK